MRKNKAFWFSCLCLLLSLVNASAQKNDKIDKHAFEILDNAFMNMLNKGDVAMYFEGIAYGIDDPVAIFKLPVYKVTRGGFLIIKDKKYEMQLGTVKTLSDGKISVVVDEISKTMYVDSVRNLSKRYYSDKPDMMSFFKKEFGSAALTYDGLMPVNGKSCHKVTATFTKDGMAAVYYIEEKTGNLYLMADKQHGAYNAYWFSKITTVPEKYKFDIKLPSQKELTSYHGYTVIDSRFVNNQLKKRR